MPIVDVSDIDAMHLHNVDDSGIENRLELNQDSQDVVDDQDKIITTTFYIDTKSSSLHGFKTHISDQNLSYKSGIQLIHYKIFESFSFSNKVILAFIP